MTRTIDTDNFVAKEPILWKLSKNWNGTLFNYNVLFWNVRTLYAVRYTVQLQSSFCISISKNISVVDAICYYFTTFMFRGDCPENNLVRKINSSFKWINAEKLLFYVSLKLNRDIKNVRALGHKRISVSDCVYVEMKHGSGNGNEMTRKSYKEIYACKWNDMFWTVFYRKSGRERKGEQILKCNLIDDGFISFHFVLFWIELNSRREMLLMKFSTININKCFETLCNRTMMTMMMMMVVCGILVAANIFKTKWKIFSIKFRLVIKHQTFLSKSTFLLNTHTHQFKPSFEVELVRKSLFRMKAFLWLAFQNDFDHFDRIFFFSVLYHFHNNTSNFEHFHRLSTHIYRMLLAKPLMSKQEKPHTNWNWRCKGMVFLCLWFVLQIIYLHAILIILILLREPLRECRQSSLVRLDIIYISTFFSTTLPRTTIMVCVSSSFERPNKIDDSIIICNWIAWAMKINININTHKN